MILYKILSLFMSQKYDKLELDFVIFGCRYRYHRPSGEYAE